MSPLRPRLLSGLQTINGSWICRGCRCTPQPTYVLDLGTYCAECAGRLLKIEFMDLLLEASPELTLDGLMVHVAALVVDERLRLTDDAELPPLTGADRKALTDAVVEANGDELDEKSGARIKALQKAIIPVLDGCSQIEAWLAGAHVPEALAPFGKALVARGVMFSRLLDTYEAKLRAPENPDHNRAIDALFAAEKPR